MRTRDFGGVKTLPFRPPGNKAQCGEKFRLAQGHERSSPASGFSRRVLIRKDERSAGQHGAHDFPLHSDAAAVDDAEGFQAQAVRFLEIGFDDGFHLFGLDGVEVKDVGNRDGDRLLVVAHGTLKSIIADAISLRKEGR